MKTKNHFPPPRETKRNKLIPAGRGLVAYAKRIAKERTEEFYRSKEDQKVRQGQTK